MTKNKKTTKDSKSRPVKNLEYLPKPLRSNRTTGDSGGSFDHSPGYGGGSSYFDPSQSDLDRREYEWENGY